jgi:predicted ester cyclase
MYDALNRQDLEAHYEFWHEDMIWHGPPGFGDIHGIKGFQDEVLKPFYKAFPDYFAKNDIEVADANMVSATGFVTAHQRGEWLGFAPTGRFMRMRFSDFWSVKDGKLHENWVMVDHVDVMKQLGLDLMAGIKGES